MGNVYRPESGHNEPDRLIGTVMKNKRENISVATRCYKGYRFVDLRVMALQADSSTLLTGKVRPEAIPEIIRLLRQAHSNAVEAGWCSGDGT
jgi:hypothetical protein